MIIVKLAGIFLICATYEMVHEIPVKYKTQIKQIPLKRTVQLPIKKGNNEIK